MDIDEQEPDKLTDYEKVVEFVIKTKQPLDEAITKRLDLVIKDIDTGHDPVYQGCILQMIADLASSAQALSYLEEQRVPQRLLALLNQSDPLIVPHALKLFYRIDPSQFETKYQQVLDTIFSYFQSENNQLVDYGVDFIAHIGRYGYKARRILTRHQGFKKKCLNKMGSILITSDSLLKCRTLECIKDLLEIHQGDPIEELSDQSETFYHDIIEGELKMTNQLLALCRVPFKEISSSAAVVVKTVNEYKWGKEELSRQPEILKFIKH